MLDLLFSPFPLLNTDRLQLRQISMDDAAEILTLRSDTRVMQYLDRPALLNIDEAKEMVGKIEKALADNAGITWAIALKDDPELIGTIGFWKINKDDHRGEIGYMLHPAFQGKGIMMEAMKLVLEYGFQRMKLHSVEANVNPGNLASIKLLGKNHFIQEAYFRENYYYNGKFLDSAIYSLLAPA
jgi:ribosomal-protein-alanine N-acetyltransferase